jgi:hypothetical protein
MHTNRHTSHQLGFAERTVSTQMLPSLITMPDLCRGDTSRGFSLGVLNSMYSRWLGFGVKQQDQRMSIHRLNYGRKPNSFLSRESIQSTTGSNLNKLVGPTDKCTEEDTTSGTRRFPRMSLKVAPRYLRGRGAAVITSQIPKDGGNL